ncbi:hypothetical protein [uncultured Lacinutrix sp.]|uniref:hypothetical protein n=1 Tax=uncultured Lacinutrix sp. TaxID=574032 RepID=UPI0026088D6E|nr:hypothetical protein [uncultured Lacinutrix sp.]
MNTKNMNDIVNISDLKKIIHELILFIVVEGKKNVSEEKIDEYVSSYTKCFVNAMNNSNAPSNEHKIMEAIKIIQNDIKNHLSAPLNS